MNDTDPASAARAIGICDGLVSAAWVYPDGSADTSGTNFHIGHGILTAFGANNPPQEGDALLALSSGTARTPAHAGYALEFDKGYGTTPPAGFPKSDVACPSVNAAGRDGIALSVVLVVPAGVRSFAVSYNFFSRDYTQWVCTQYVDQAAALATGISGLSGAQNIFLDAQANALFASPTSMQACAFGTHGTQQYTCPLGTGLLAGTGFDTNGATGWLRTSNFPVVAGDTLRLSFMIWDSGDGDVDATLLVDRFTWEP
jgi:hypothetical protein